MNKIQTWIIIVLLVFIAGSVLSFTNNQKTAAASRAQDCFTQVSKKWSTIGQYPSTQGRADEIATEETACYTNEGLPSANYYITVPSN